MPTENQAPTPKTYTEDEYNALSAQLTEANALTDSQKKTIEERNAKIADLEAKLDAKPADTTSAVLEPAKKSKSEPQSDAEAFCNTVNSARALFNSI